MEEVKDSGSFFDPPAFLDALEPVVFGFGGPILILIVFVALNKTKLTTGTLMLIVLLLYVFSILTGAALYDVLGNRPSAFIAAFWAPMTYCLITTGFVHFFYKPPEAGSAGYDHLIH